MSDMAIIPTPPKPPKKARKADEAKLQADAFAWLWNTHPETRLLFFACLNENERSVYESKKQQEISGARRRMRGVVSGVADSIGLIPRGKYHGVCAEAKTEKGIQSAHQQEWQRTVESAGFYYFIYRSLEDFKQEMEKYLNL